ncbi:MAG TPA: MATE family efflux transporter [bacterium]|nr:MATE family efflux transporter [bacterium]
METNKLTESGVKSTLFRMALPMLAGTIAMNAYNFADTWFVSKLGTLPLAAMGFSFPVVIFLTFIAGGIGTGVTAVTSSELGRGDKNSASRIVTHGIIIILFFSIILTIAGYLSIEPVFTKLGADKMTMPLISDYMKTWYMGSAFMAIPFMGNGVLISLGDSKAASGFMVMGAAMNCILDPIMIFGWFGFPALGIFGAALATVIAQILSCMWLFYLLGVRYKLIRLKHLEFNLFKESFKQIMRFAIPGSISMILMPISSAVITKLISGYGREAVAAAGAASRVEMLAFVIPMALGMSLIPFVSQNYGAEKHIRIKKAKSYSTRFAFIYGACITGILFFAAPVIAGLFTADPKVSVVFILYIRIVSFGYGMMEIHRYSGFLMTGIHKPEYATLINMFRVIILLLPLSFAGNYFAGIKGIFAGRLITDLTAGAAGFVWITNMLNSKLRNGLIKF